MNGKDHPVTSYIPLRPPRTNFRDYSDIFKNDPFFDLPFLNFPTSLHVKRLALKGKKMRMDHPFILGFCQNLTFYSVFTNIFPLWGKNPLS